VSEGERLEVRSYRDVFALERRLYRIDTVRLNPGGVPIRGVVYCGVLLALLLALASLPVTGWFLALLPWYARDVVLPAGGAALLALVRVEGRAFHLAAYALARHVCSDRQLSGLVASSSVRAGRRWVPPELVLLADGSDARLRRLRFVGPGALLVAVPHICSEHARIERPARPQLRVSGARSRVPLASARVLTLADGTRIDVYPA
jgi:hypothetical protein